MTLIRRPAIHGSVDIMAGISAGVVGSAEVNSQSPTPTKFGHALSQPATWSAIWFGLSVVYLLAIYFGMLRIGRNA